MSNLKSSKVRPPRTVMSVDPYTRSVISKLVSPETETGSRYRSDASPIRPPDGTTLQKLVSKTALTIRDNHNIFEMLPDMELCRQFMVSAILSPGDMISTDFIYGCDTDKLPDGLITSLLETVKDKFSDAYPLEENAENIVSNALYLKGAHPIVVLPENSIDYTINSNQTISSESLMNTKQFNSDGKLVNIGLLGPADSTPSVENIFLNLSMDKFNYNNQVNVDKLSITLEDLNSHELNTIEIDKDKLSELGTLSVHDNPSILRMPEIQERIRKQRVDNFYGSALSKTEDETVEVSNEEYELARYDSKDAVIIKNATDISLSEVHDVTYPKRNFKLTPMQPILTKDQLSRKTKGDPLVIEPPMGSIIPVHVPGNPRKHVGYWALLDSNGNFIETSLKGDSATGGNGCGRDPMNEASQILDTATLSGYGYRSESQVVQDELARSYGSVVEADLLNRLRNGKLGSDYEVGMGQDVMRIMWSRALSKKNTVMLYIPAEFVVYIANDYNEYGIGKSITESSKILASIRANLTIASLLASIKNSTGTRTARIKLPEHDDNPDASVEYMMHQFYELNNNQVGLSETNPNVLMSHIQNTGVNVVVDNHPLYPDVSFDVETREGTNKEPDREFIEDMRKQHIQSFGLTPEQIDASMGADFAVSVIQNNHMTTKRVAMLQKTLNPHFTRLIRVWTENSEPAIKELMEIARNAKGVRGDLRGKPKAIVEHFLETLEVSLPKPKTQSFRDMNELVTDYEELLDKVLAYYVSDEMFEIASEYEDVDGKLDQLKETIKALLMRRFVAQHNIIPEANITNTVGEGKNGAAGELFKELVNYTDNTAALISSVLENMERNSKKRGGGEDDDMDDGGMDDDNIDIGEEGDIDVDDNAEGDEELGVDDTGEEDTPAVDESEDDFEDSEGNVNLPDMPDF